MSVVRPAGRTGAHHARRSELEEAVQDARWAAVQDCRGAAQDQVARHRHVAGASQGGVLQLPTRVESAWLQRLKLPYDKRLSSFAFNSNLRLYTKAVMASVAEGQTNGGALHGAPFAAQPDCCS